MLMCWQAVGMPMNLRSIDSTPGRMDFNSSSCWGRHTTHRDIH